jgi:glycosyltransferase involved in cell wall biosynthesis
MKQTVVFTYAFRSTFVAKDMEILRPHFELECFDFFTTAKWKTPLLFFRQLLFLLKTVRRAQLHLIQFAGYHSLLPCLFARFFRLPAVIMIGGTDAVAFPSIGYGNFQKRGVKTFTEWSYRLCTYLLPKHISLLECEYNYTHQDHLRQGVFYFMPGLHKPFKVIHNGYDSAKWMVPEGIRRESASFVSISSGWHNPFQFRMKGIDMMYAAAMALPEFNFELIGVPDTSLLPPPPPNLVLHPPLPNHELPGRLGGKCFYLQLSLAEGFPNALCEAMLCGLVPVVSDVFSMPGIVGETGYVLRSPDVAELTALLRKAVEEYHPGKAIMVRKRIEENYPLELRTNELVGTLKSLIENK